MVQRARVRTFRHLDSDYEIVASIDSTDDRNISVEVMKGGRPVVYEYDDGVKATVRHSVSLETKIEIEKALAINAIESFAQSAEEQVRRWVKR